LRTEREFALHGDIDFIPTEQSTWIEAQRAIDDVELAMTVATAAADSVAPSTEPDDRTR
jgi:hypothetical protein